MPLYVPDLLADPTLRLIPRTRHCMKSEVPISWHSTTELPDPLPFLRGGELVMTTGLNERTTDEWENLVRRLARLPVAALCFGTGLIHTEVPSTVVKTAEESGLSLVESPVDVPFIQISRWVADRLFAEQYDAVGELVTIQDELIRRLLDGGGLRALVRTLHTRISGRFTAVVQVDGKVLSCFPGHATGEAERIHAERSLSAAVHSIPITVDNAPVAYLYAADVTERDNLLFFAANILGLELARRQAVLNGRRELLGQIIEDIAQRTTSDAQARRRLHSLGVSVEDPFYVVLAAIPRSHGESRGISWGVSEIGEEDADPLPMAFAHGDVVVIVPGALDPWASAEKMHRRLQRIHPDIRVGVSQERVKIAGLRMSYHEARHASRRGRGVNTSEPLSLEGLLLGNLDLPLRDLARSVLKPLLDYDTEHHVHLVETLRAYLGNSCSAKRTAEALALHRNGLRYRLELIEQLTGRDLSELTQQLELALALTAFDLPSAP